MSNKFNLYHYTPTENIDINIPENILNLLWFLDGPKKNYDMPKQIEESVPPIENCTILHSSPKYEPSAISCDCYIERPPEKLFKDVSNYGREYLNLNKFERYCYLNWLSDITKPFNNTIVFFYGLERHIYYHTPQYDTAIDTAIKILDSTMDRRQFNAEVCSLIYLLEADSTKQSQIRLIINKFECSEHFRFSDWYLYYKHKINAPFEFADFERFCFSKIYGISQGMIPSKLRSKLFNKRSVLNKAWDIYIKKNGIIKYSYKCHNKKLIDMYIPLNKSISSKIKIPQLIDSASEWITIIAQDILTIVTSLKIQTEPNIKMDVISNKKNINVSNSLLFSKLFSPTDPNIFKPYVEAFQKSVCPTCENPILIPLSSCTCRHCKTKIWVREEIITSQMALLDNQGFETLKKLKDELVRRDTVLRSIITYCHLNLNEIETVYKNNSGHLSVEQCCELILKDYIQLAWNNKNQELVSLTLKSLANFYFFVVHNLSIARTVHIVRAFICFYYLGTQGPQKEIVKNGKTELYTQNNDLSEIFSCIARTIDFHTTVSNYKEIQDSINWTDIYAEIDFLQIKLQKLLNEYNFLDVGNIIKEKVKELVDKNFYIFEQFS